MEYGQVPDLTELTYAVHECIVDRVRQTANSAVNPNNCEFVIISGIQVHTGFTQNFFWPGTATKHSSAGCVDLMGEYRASVAQDKRDMFAGLVMVRGQSWKPTQSMIQMQHLSVYIAIGNEELRPFAALPLRCWKN